MGLSSGTRLGAYEILELLGEGGMGAVYRAHDPRLGRDVAIKIVRAVFGDDPDRAARFDREARLLASLNHPHIATVHGLEEAGGTRFLVLELVPGVTLADRLRAGPLPVRDALTLALQITGAIEAAHERKVVHRDLKPANIKITPAGTAKVLDFGIAKALDIEANAAAPTLTSGGTGEGVILGTAAYMSPEQARGKPVDKRTDIWSFGCVFFDMLTARPAFAGDTLSDTLAAILTRDPDWTLLPPDVPTSVRRLLRRCLEKDLSRRLRDIGDARFEIEEALASTDSGAVSVAGVTAPPRATRWGGPAIAGAALVAGVLIGAALPWLATTSSRADARPPVQFTLPLAESDRLASLDFQMVAISPSETHVAYVASRRGHAQLFLRALSAVDAVPLAGTTGAINPFFSPDGQWIAFFADGRLKKVDISSGAVRDVADAELGFGGVWAPDGTIVFAPSNASPLSRVSAEGGTPVPITTLDQSRGEFSHRWPELLPGGQTVIFAIGTVGNWDDADLAVQPLAGGTRKIVLQGGTNPRYAPTGHLLYARRGALAAVRFNVRTLQVSGSSTPVMQGVLQSPDGAAQFAISPAGSFVYVPGGDSEKRHTLVWVDREGAEQPLAAPPGAYASPRLSPDGRAIALAGAGSPQQIWTYWIADTTLAQLTLDGGSSPVWSHDGQRIFFSAARNGPPALFVKAADGSSGDQRITASDRAGAPQSTGATGDVLLARSDAATGRDIARLTSDGTVQPLLATPANESAPALSPDGRTFAYVSDDTGRLEVFLASIDTPSHRVQVSHDGGTEPVWRRDGSELFFRSGRRMMVATVRRGAQPAVSTPRLLFDATYESGSAASAAYDVSRDGMRFLMLKSASSDVGRELRVVLGWTAALERSR